MKRYVHVKRVFAWLGESEWMCWSAPSYFCDYFIYFLCTPSWSRAVIIALAMSILSPLTTGSSEFFRPRVARSYPSFSSLALARILRRGGTTHCDEYESGFSSFSFSSNSWLCKLYSLEMVRFSGHGGITHACATGFVSCVGSRFTWC